MDILERFHLALSYQEKAEAELANWSRIRDTESFDHSQYDLVKSRYERHVKQAREITRTIRQGQKNSIPDLEAEVRRIDRVQRKLLESISAGKLKTKQANAQNRAIVLEKDRIEGMLFAAHTITDAESTVSLGGAIKLSFEDFIEKLEIDEVTEAAIKPRKDFKATNVAILVLLGVIGWAFWVYYDALGKASWQADVIDAKQTIRIRCENIGDNTIRVQVPWPEGRTTDDIPARLRHVTFGVLVYIREKGKTDYQLLPESRGIWKYAGAEYDSTVPLLITPGEETTFSLDVMALRELGLSVEAVKVEYSRYGGRRVGGHELKSL